jgi:fumarylacetoacetase
MLNAGEAAMKSRILPASFSYFLPGYGGRASSILVSGTEIPRPLGMYRYAREPAGVTFGPQGSWIMSLRRHVLYYRRLSRYRVPVSVDDAEEHIFGSVLLNDWSG